MIVKGIIDEDFINYKKPSMIIEMPYCSFKCDKECEQQVCQNSELANAPNITVNTNDLVRRYINNPITKAVVFQGLEPFDSYSDMELFIEILREDCYNHDDVVIYTGYKEEEIKDKIEQLKDQFDNIIVKFGRFIPNQKSRFDELLGVKLASDNQYARQI